MPTLTEKFWEEVWGEFHVWKYERITKTSCSQCGTVKTHEPEWTECQDKIVEIITKSLMRKRIITSKLKVVK